MKRAMQIVFAISLVGASFSGTLTYRELFAGGGASCSAIGTPGTIFGYPACVYGFVMFTLLTLISGASLWRGEPAFPRTVEP